MSTRGLDRGRLRTLLDRLARERADLERLASVPTEELLAAEADLLPTGLSEQLVRMARFRNLLVHQYATVDDRQVIDILHTRAVDLTDFSRAISGLLIEPDGQTP